MNLDKEIVKLNSEFNTATPERTFQLACRYGLIELAKQIAIQYNPDVNSGIDYAFRKACQYGHIEIAQWLYSSYDIDISAIEYDAFVCACSNGYIDIVNWLMRLMGDNIVVNNCLAIIIAIDDSRQTIVEILLNSEFYSEKILREFDILYWSCCRSLSMVKLVAAKLNNIIANSDIKICFETSCFNGTIDIIEWLVSVYHSTLMSDDYYSSNRFFRRVCMRGFVSTISWLYNHIKLPKLKNRDVQQIISNGHLAAVKFLYEKDLIKFDFEKTFPEFFSLAMNEHHIDICEWFMTFTEYMSQINIQEIIFVYFQKTNINIEFVEWLTSNFDVDWTWNNCSSIFRLLRYGFYEFADRILKSVPGLLQNFTQILRRQTIKIVIPVATNDVGCQIIEFLYENSEPSMINIYLNYHLISDVDSLQYIAENQVDLFNIQTAFTECTKYKLHNWILEKYPVVTNSFNINNLYINSVRKKNIKMIYHIEKCWSETLTKETYEEAFVFACKWSDDCGSVVIQHINKVIVVDAPHIKRALEYAIYHDNINTIKFLLRIIGTDIVQYDIRIFYAVLEMYRRRMAKLFYGAVPGFCVDVDNCFYFPAIYNYEKRHLLKNKFSRWFIKKSRNHGMLLKKICDCKSIKLLDFAIRYFDISEIRVEQYQELIDSRISHVNNAYNIKNARNE